MSSPPELPEHLARIVDQLVELAVSDPEVYESAARLEERARALRSRFHSSLSAALAKRNDDRGRTESRALPDDALFKVFDHLSFEDVFGVTQVCSQWRAVALSSPRLWTHLEVRATHVHPARDEVFSSAIPDSDEWDDEDSYDKCVNVSNLHFLQNLLPRAQAQPLTLTVALAEPGQSISRKLVDELSQFLKLVAPRIVMLHVHTSRPELVKWILGTTHWDWPILRRLACSNPCEPPFGHKLWPVDLSRVACPMLAHIDLGPRFELVGLKDQPVLTHLRTSVKKLALLVPLLLASPALTRLELTASIYDLRRIDRLDIQAALNAVHELRLRTQHNGTLLGKVLPFFQCLRCRRIVLEITECAREPAFFPWPIVCGRWADAAQIVLRGAPDAVELVFTDAARRTLSVRLLDNCPFGAHTRCIDWKRVAALGALTSLRVDASVWDLVMHNFPSAPLLSETTLVVDGAGGLDAVMVGGTGGLDIFPAIRDLTQAAVALEDRVSAVPPVPRGSALVLSSDAPVFVTKWSAADVKKRLLVDRVVLDGVSMQELSATRDECSTK